jgi:hypothetical protein
MIEKAKAAIKSLLIKDEFDFSKYPVTTRDVDVQDLNFHNLVFLVTPGRSGTKSLIDYLLRHSNFCAVHAPKPCLATMGSLLWQKKIDKKSAQWAYFFAREKLIYESFRRGAPFVDGDCKNLPLLPVLSEFFPHSKFVHVVRNPIDFVKSGLNRGYYVEKDPIFWGHLFSGNDKPVGSNFEEQVQLIAEFWEISNVIAEDVANKVGPSRFNTLKSESMFKKSEEIVDVFESLGFGNFNSVSNGSLEKLNQNKKSKYYDEDLIFKIVKDKCPSAKIYYPEIFC